MIGDEAAAWMTNGSREMLGRVPDSLAHRLSTMIDGRSPRQKRVSQNVAVAVEVDATVKV